jgi:hypothetical protein
MVRHLEQPGIEGSTPGDAPLILAASIVLWYTHRSDVADSLTQPVALRLAR